MKISFVLQGSGRSGGIKSTVKTANGLLQRGHQVRLLVNKGNVDLRTKLRQFWLKTRYPGSSDWLDIYEGKVEKFNDIERCVFEDNEVVVASGWWAAKEMRRVNNGRLIKVHHMRGTFESRSHMVSAWGEDVPKIGVSSQIEKVVEEMLGQKIIATIPNGIDTGEYYPCVPDDQRDGVGTIYSQAYPKDPETILKVLSVLRERYPNKPQYIFGASRRPKQISRKIYNRLPTLEKAREMYSRSFVWFLASRSEGFPAPLLEAMCCGCAVVSTYCSGGSQDIIKDGENGFLAEVSDVEQIVNKIELLLKDEGLRQKFVTSGYDTVKKFSWDNSIDKLERALVSLATAR